MSDHVCTWILLQCKNQHQAADLYPGLRGRPCRRRSGGVTPEPCNAELCGELLRAIEEWAAPAATWFPRWPGAQQGGGKSRLSRLAADPLEAHVNRDARSPGTSTAALSVASQQHTISVQSFSTSHNVLRTTHARPGHVSVHGSVDIRQTIRSFKAAFAPFIRTCLRAPQRPMPAMLHASALWRCARPAARRHAHGRCATATACARACCRPATQRRPYFMLQ